jgi:formylglycine-generating enzyme required for sulfatase activity
MAKTAGAQVWLDADGKSCYYSEIDVWPRDDLLVRFELVRRTQTKDSDDPATFYLMRDKVWVQLYEEFVRSRGDPGITERWNAAKRAWPWEPRPNLPALGVNWNDAQEFAKWLAGAEGGRLPTGKEWRKAAGHFEREWGQGPSAGLWKRFVLDSLRGLTFWPDPLVRAALLTEPVRDLGVAVRREQPMDIGSAWLDISPYNCRDLSGNGSEWVQDPQEQQRVQYGWSYRKLKPLFLEDRPGADSPDTSENYIGFRIVIIPKPSS